MEGSMEMIKDLEPPTVKGNHVNRKIAERDRENTIASTSYKTQDILLEEYESDSTQLGIGLGYRKLLNRVDGRSTDDMIFAQQEKILMK